MNALREVLVWRVVVGVALLLTTIFAFSLRWRAAKLWWIVGGGLGLLLTTGVGGSWEFWVLVWSAPLLAAYFRQRPNDRTLFAERFATTDEIRPYLAKLGGAQARCAILAGTVWQQRLWQRVASWVALQPVPDRPEVGHGLIVAPTGLGKGLAIVTQLLQNTDHSAIVLDLKGEAYQLTSQARFLAGHQIIRLDLGGGLQGHQWDPTDHARDEDDLRLIAQALTHDPRDRDPFWAQAAEEMLTAAMLAARICGQAVFPFLRGLFDQGIKGATELVHEINPALGARFLAGGRAESKMMLGIWVTLVARLRPLLTDRMLAVFGGNDFSIADLRARQVTVYITVPEAHLERLAPALAAVWTGLISALVAHADTTSPARLRPVLLMLDEAGRIPIPRLPGYLATLRSRGVTCLVYVQSFSQLSEKYGADQARSIFNNCALQIFYQQHDEVTAWTVSRRLGQTSDVARGYSVTANAGILGVGVATRTATERGRPLLTPQEVLRLPERSVLVFYRALHPIWIDRLDWREHSALRELATLPPIELPHLTPWTGVAQQSPLTTGKTKPGDEYMDPDC